MPQTVDLQLDAQCRGVTDEYGRKFQADKHGTVTLPSHLADQLKESGAARKSGRIFGGIDLPKKA